MSNSQRPPSNWSYRMNAVTIPDPGLDLPTLTADALVDSGMFDALLEGAGRTLKAIPRVMIDWLGPECRTPSNSSPPNVTPTEPGLWNGVVFLEANEASYWILVKANAGKRPQTHGQPPPFGGRDPHGRSDSRWPHDPPGAQSLWPEAPPNEPPPWEDDPWRR